MRMLIGVGLGIALCAFVPDVPLKLKAWINYTASEIAVATDPSFKERAESALTDWRN